MVGDGGGDPEQLRDMPQTCGCHVWCSFRSSAPLFFQRGTPVRVVGRYGLVLAFAAIRAAGSQLQFVQRSGNC